MSGGPDLGRWSVLVALATVVVAVIVAVMLPMVDLRAPGDGTTAPAASPAPAAAEPVRLAHQVTKVAADPAASLDLVHRTQTAVFAVDDPGTAAPAGMLALHLRAPVILVPTGERSRGQASEPARADLAAAARERGVAKAITVGDGVEDVAARSGAREIVRVPADVAAATDPAHVIAAASEDPPAPSEPAAGHGDLERHRSPPPPPTGTALLVRRDAPEALAAVVAARAVGHTIVATEAEDLRADPSVGRRLAEVGDGDGPPPLVLAGAAFAGADERAVQSHAAVAINGQELPGGGQLVFDPRRPLARRYVGLYGAPGVPELGALGEQPVDDSVARVERLAREYRGVVDGDVAIVPCFEIIATIASASAGDDGNFSREQPIDALQEAVDAAGDAGIYVLLDLQPGRTDFVTQAKHYEPLLRAPHVGLALDPEWRLGPGERHLKQVGSVGIDEVNEVARWLADLVGTNRLPQKMLLLHQFRMSMLPDRDRLDTSRDELAYVIQMDGQGSQRSKLDTWRAVTADPPDNVQFGWKNFHDEDQPTRSPADTMALEPQPVFVSYQ